MGIVIGVSAITADSLSGEPLPFYKPVLLCDQCGRLIGDANQAYYLYDQVLVPAIDRQDFYQVTFIHFACDEAFWAQERSKTIKIAPPDQRTVAHFLLHLAYNGTPGQDNPLGKSVEEMRRDYAGVGADIDWAAVQRYLAGQPELPSDH